MDSEDVVSRLDAATIARISVNSVVLKAKIEEWVESEKLSEKGLQVLFNDFLRTVLQDSMKTKKFVLLGGCEIDMRVDNITKASGNPPSIFVEMKIDDSNLKDAIFQAAVYAYGQCIVNETTIQEAILIAISLPNYRARTGILKLRLNETTLGIEDSTLEMGMPFSWEEEKGAQKIVAHFSPRPQETTVDANTADTVDLVSASDEVSVTGRQQPAPRRKRTKKK